MIKNVIVVNDYDYVQGGASLVAIETANLLFSSGYNVVFFCGISNNEKSVLNRDIKVVSSDIYDCLTNPSRVKGMLQGLNNKTAYKKMDELLSSLNAKETVVSIHGYTKSLSTSFIKACKKHGVKTLLTAHDYFSICPNGGLFNYKKNYCCSLQGTKKCKWCNCDSRNYAFKWYRNLRFLKQNTNNFRENIDYLITISETNESLLAPFFKKSRIVRIYNPTSITEKIERIQCEDNSFYLYVGRVDKEKGIDFMCQSFANSTEKLVIVGDGTELSNLKTKYNLSNIYFTGWLDHVSVLEKMKHAKALIFPPLLYEGAPLTIFEAQSFGIPVIVSKFSNGKDFVSDEIGWIYDPFVIEELTQIINSPHGIKEKSMNSYDNYWKNPYSKKRYVKAMCELLEDI